MIQTLLDGHPALQVVNVDGSKLRTLTVTEAYGPRWSPDGTRIAYFSSVDGPGIYVTGVDGLVIHKVVSTPVGSRTLTWSPDGRQLAFAYASDATSTKALSGDTSGWGGVFVINSDGTGLSTLARGPAGFPDSASRTPDSRLCWATGARALVATLRRCPTPGSSATQGCCRHLPPVEPGWQVLVWGIPPARPLLESSFARAGAAAVPIRCFA